MANNEIYFRINGKEALNKWGVYMGDGSLTALMTPPPNKEYVSSECPLENGKRTLANDTRISDRDITLILYMRASSLQDFITKYDSLCAELAGGSVDIETKFLPGRVFRCVYVSCSEFRQYDGRLAMFSLRLNEPDPSNRSKL